MVGEARGDRRQARRPGLRLTARLGARTLRLAAAAAVGACAYAAGPPGGPPRTTPPQVLQVVPESGAVLTEMPHQAEIVFDEVISERPAGAGAGGGSTAGQYLKPAVLLSPAPGVSVSWHRQRITVRPRGGFQPGRIYRLQLLPLITDLRNNRLLRGLTVVFSTGPDIPHATLAGTVVDWGGNRAGAGALIQAELLPDTVPYLTLADSGGNFRMAQMPPGDYLVYSVLDQNGNRLRDAREAFDSVRVTVADTGSVQLYAFVHDTLAPRIKTVDLEDSLTVRIVFDRLLDPVQALDTSQVHLAPFTDSTTMLAIAGVATPAAFDSARKAAAALQDSLRRAAEADSLRKQAHADSLRGIAAAPRRPVRPPPLPPAATGGRGPTRTTPLDTAQAMAMLRRRPAPTDTRIVELTAPLEPGSRYLVRVTGVRSVSGVAGNSQSTLPVPVPKPRPKAAGRRAAADTTRGAADTTRAVADTTRAVRADTTRADTTRAPARPDTTKAPAPPDTAAPPRKPTPP